MTLVKGQNGAQDFDTVGEGRLESEGLRFVDLWEESRVDF